MAAAARVHRCNKLNPRREGDMGIGASTRNLACFQGLTQRVEYSALELGQLVEEEDAEVRHAHLTRSRLVPAAD